MGLQSGFSGHLRRLLTILWQSYINADILAPQGSLCQASGRSATTCPLPNRHTLSTDAAEDLRRQPPLEGKDRNLNVPSVTLDMPVCAPLQCSVDNLSFVQAALACLKLSLGLGPSFANPRSNVAPHLLDISGPNQAQTI